MKRFYSTLFATLAVSCFPAIAGAAGTYYNGNTYQNAQSRYSNGSYNNRYSNGRGYDQTNQNFGRNSYKQYGQNNYMTKNQDYEPNNARAAKSMQKKDSTKQGFFGSVGLSHEFGQWKFDMKNAGSQLHYDNLSWNVLTAGGKYYFDGDTPLVVSAGLRYGMQYDKATMVDDDISNGGTDAVVWYDDTDKFIGVQAAHAISIGTSQNGSQLGFNAAVGLTDLFSWGKVKVTPSVGYRYFRHKLTTEKNFGMTMDVFHAADPAEYITCYEEYEGEVRCIPFIAFINGDQDTVGSLGTDENGYLVPGVVPITSGATEVDIGDTFYYEQYGKSHSYDTSWAGPYVALDMEYNIDSDNSFIGGIELGLPIYDAKGDQPYRTDWQHPVSVEDKGKLGDAIHLGLNANWMTAVSDTMSLTFGFTYDFYKVSGAKAITYLNGSYYSSIYDTYLTWYNDETNPDTYQNPGLYKELAEINGYRSNGWKVEDNNEVNSIYKSMGLRIGLVAKF